MIRWLWAVVALGAMVSCGTTTSQKLSGLGETCMERTDCEGGLACQGGVCTERSFDLEQSNKKCVIVECRQNEDCCGSLCRTYRDECDRGDTAACTSADAACDCGATCRDGACTQTCSDTEPCSGGEYCAGSRCVECACDAHCGADGVCKDGSCMPACKDDGDCGTTTSASGERVLTRCSDGACVETGCTTNRECVSLVGDTRAICDSGDCRMPCKSDIECDDPEDFDFVACVGGVCRSLGCESTEECRSLVYRRGDAGLDVECKEWTPPGPLAPGVGGDTCPGGTPLDCGDGVLDIGEECDSGNFGGETCASASGGALPSGSLDCTSFCEIDTSFCSGGSGFCGDGFVDFGLGEECDGRNFGGETCASYAGLPGGTLDCFDCTIDTSSCTSSAGFCGDGNIDSGEECDGGNFGGETCASYTGLPSGTLYCFDCAVDTSFCTSSAGFCGDGNIDSGEDCDGTNLGGETCSTATFGARPVGSPFCSGCVLNTGTCTAVSSGFCGDGLIGQGEECDGINFDGNDCLSWTGGSSPFGALQCSGCFIDSSSCTSGCDDSCIWADDGVCDDPLLCNPGTDCTDCGP